MLAVVLLCSPSFGEQAPTEQKPVTPDQNPVTTEQKPVTSEQNPVITDQKPVTIEDLQRRINELEVKQAELIQQMQSQHPGDVLQPAPEKPAEKKPGEEKMPVQSTVKVDLYGYIKLDAAWDQARIDQGNYARWVLSEDGRENDSQFNMTANQTRIGLKFRGPDVGPAQTSGLIEMDFYGGGSENKPNPMLRKAYAVVSWPDLDLSILGGQDIDTISPLVAETINYTVLWWVGNIGYRRPQLRVTKGFGLGGDFRLELQAAAARAVGRVALFNNKDFSPGDSGEDSGFPTAQGRIALTFPFVGPTPATVGVSGHYGQEELDYDAENGHVTLDSWSVNFDATMPVTKWLRIKGEGFAGADLDVYLGGIGQGVTIIKGTVPNPAPPPDTLEVLDRAYEVHSYGGWLIANVGPFGDWNFNAGAAADNPENSDLVAGDRTLNYTYFGNFLVKVYQTTQFGLEVSWWRTDYKQKEAGDSLRVQATMIFNF